MTAQFSDLLVLGRRTLSIAGVKGEGLFDPRSLGLHPIAPCTACWRGYLCRYAVKDDQLFLAELCLSIAEEHAPTINGVEPSRPPEGIFDHVYKTLDLPVAFSGGLLAGEGFVRELYVHMGYHPAWKYRTVLELVFEGGRLVEQRDVSRRMQEIRGKMARRPLRLGTTRGEEEVRAWIASTFRLSYDL